VLRVDDAIDVELGRPCAKMLAEDWLPGGREGGRSMLAEPKKDRQGLEI
jgi:hypothetical protein